MSVHIDCKKRTILHVKNSTFGFLYQNMEQIVDEKTMHLSDNLRYLMEKLDLGGYGIGCDIADFLKGRNEAEIFTAIVGEAINRYVNEFPSIDQDRKNRLENFHKALLKYVEELKD